MNAMMTTPNAELERPEKDKLLIISAQKKDELFNKTLATSAFSEIDEYPHTGVFGRSYHPAIHGNHDASFAVFAGELALLVCLCAPSGETLGFYGMPTRFIVRKGLGRSQCSAAIKAAFDHL